jgi:hypothetical protein
LAVPSFSFAGTENSADLGNLNLKVSIAISKQAETFNYVSQSIEFKGMTPFSKDEALDCSKSRADAYLVRAIGSTQIQPSMSRLLNPCRTFYSDIEKASYDSGLMKSWVPRVLAGVSPSPQFQYGGWDNVLSRLALDALDSGKSLRAELDPTGQARLIGIVADHLETLKSELSRTKNLSSAKGSVFQMGLEWSFEGQLVSPDRIAQILGAVDNSIDTFKVSSERLLADLGRQPNSSNDQLSFALNIDGVYKSEAIKALGLSNDLAYSVFQRDIFDQVIQQQISVDDLRDWSAKFAGIKSQISKYSNLGSVKGDLVGLSVKWLRSGRATPQDLESVYSAIDNSAIPFEESTRALVGDLSQSLEANKGSLDFARSISPEYKRLAISIRDNSKSADYESWGRSFFVSVLKKQPTIDQLRAWDGLWTAALAFTAREKIKTQGDFGSMNDWNRKQIIETAVREVWSNSEFTNLEILAEIARAKNSCDRYKGSSSLADCGGIRLFSKQKGMFFDPTLGDRYIVFGRDFATYMNQLVGFDWTTLRWTLVGEFFGSFEPMWSKCDLASFNQKANSLKSQVNAILREGDQFKKWELERQIKETVQNCR